MQSYSIYYITAIIKNLIKKIPSQPKTFNKNCILQFQINYKFFFSLVARKNGMMKFPEERDEEERSASKGSSLRSFAWMHTRRVDVARYVAGSSAYIEDRDKSQPGTRRRQAATMPGPPALRPLIYCHWPPRSKSIGPCQAYLYKGLCRAIPARSSYAQLFPRLGEF